jgi:hypothetical protein
MKPFEYMLLLAAVMLGLALSDLAISVQRLLNVWGRVRWGWLAPLAATLAFVKILTQWWAWFGADQLASGVTFEMFAGVLLSAGLLFLLAATSLPDEVGEHGIDLRAYYATVSRRYWILFLLQIVVANGVSLWTVSRVEGAHISLSTPLLALLPLIVALCVFRNRWFQGAALVGLLAAYVWQEFGRSLAA